MAIQFIITEELGKLAKWLRIRGYDCVYFDHKDVSELIIQTLREKRVLLTRSPALTKYHGIRVLIVKHDLVEDQVDQVMRELGLPLEEDELFQRCVECNAMLEDMKKEDIKDKVPEYVFETQEIFKRCPRCQKIFWKGTHWDMVREWLDRARGRAQGDEEQL